MKKSILGYTYSRDSDTTNARTLLLLGCTLKGAVNLLPHRKYIINTSCMLDKKFGISIRASAIS